MGRSCTPLPLTPRQREQQEAINITVCNNLQYGVQERAVSHSWFDILIYAKQVCGIVLVLERD
jgi:hypothetical protein